MERASQAPHYQPIGEDPLWLEPKEFSIHPGYQIAATSPEFANFVPANEL
jgi:hypothetical protein